MDISTESRVGDIAAAHPAATRVFARYGIDYCCSGGRTLDESCEEKEIDADAVLAEIRSEGRANDQPNRWAEASATELDEVRSVLRSAALGAGPGGLAVAG